MTNAAPAGWYVDPSDSTVEHWWDGTKYHGTRAAVPPTPAPPAPQPMQPVSVYVTAPPAGSVPAYGGRISPKSRTVASILGFFLGGLGIDRFYLGNIGMGVAKLLLGWLTCGIWPLIDWIVILAGAAHDGDGLPVTNWG
ncbi:MAG TPA: TM2 domain-containing protein [Galbitalea sp.]|nr:TM2 domain-containing protein [Galbitalea sp.]